MGRTLKLEKIWFFGVKSWFFTRDTPTIFASPSARRNFFRCAPPNLKSWIHPCTRCIWVFILHSQQHCITIRFYIALSHSCILDTILLKLFKGEFAVVPADKICGRSLSSKIPVFNKTKRFVGRNTSDYACQIFCSKSNSETMYHWFFLLEITVVKIMNNLNACSAHSYLYPRSRFKEKEHVQIISDLQWNMSSVSVINSALIRSSVSYR